MDTSRLPSDATPGYDPLDNPSEPLFVRDLSRLIPPCEWLLENYL
jgi:hypothetical protein